MKKVVGVCICVVSLAAAIGCRATKQEYVAKGDKLYAAAKFEDAALEYRKAIQRDTTFGEAYYRLGLASIKSNNGRQAYEALLRAVELLPENMDAKAKLGDVCLNFYLADSNHPQLLYTQIKNLSDALLAKDRKSYEGLMLKGYLASTDRKPKDAIAFFRQALEADSSNPGVVTELAFLLIQDGQVQEGEKLAMDLVARQKTSYGRVYDLLYAYYMDAHQVSDAENVLTLKVANNPKKADYVVELARHYNRRRQPVEMKSALQRLLDDPKDFPQARLWVGDFYLGLRDYTAAIAYYQDGFRSSVQAKDKALYQKRNVVALLNEKKKDEAARLAEQVLRTYPKDDGAMLLHAGIMLDSGKREDTDTAASEFRTLVGQHPNDAYLHLQLARAYRLQGDLEAARGQLLQAVNKQSDLIPARYELAELSLAQQPAEAVHQASEVLKVRPRDRRARLLRASGLVGTWDGASARAELNQLIKELPQDQEPQLQLGLLALSERKYSEVIGLLDKYRAAGDTRIFSGLAVAYVSLNQIDKAQEVLGEGLRKSPGSPQLLEQLAGTEALTGQYDLAISQFRQLLTRDPNSAALRARMAEVYELMGDHRNALLHYQQAHDLAPNDVNQALNLAGALARAGSTREAKALYQSVVRTHPENAPALNNAAFFLADTNGDLDEALRLAQNALGKVPGHPGFSDTVGYIYLKKGMLNSAIQTFTNLARRYPTYANFRYHLGLALFEKGEKASARKELEAALADHPSPPDQLRIRKLLDEIS
jgi:tetratricopeptide (TPR) repeat protein